MAAGQPPETLWSLTPIEIGIVLDGVGDRMRREHEGRAWLAWHAAHLPGNTKVKFGDLIAGRKAPRPAADPEAEFAAFAAWVGGVH